MFKIVLAIIVTASLSACSTISDESSIAIDEGAKEIDPVKCQEAKLDLVEVEGNQDVSKINFVKARVHRYCDDFE